jgi:hypothetical protein
MFRTAFRMFRTAFCQSNRSITSDPIRSPLVVPISLAARARRSYIVGSPRCPIKAIVGRANDGLGTRSLKLTAGRGKLPPNEHKRAGRVFLQPFEDRRHWFGEWDPVLARGLHARGRDRPDLGLEVDLRPLGQTGLARPQRAQDCHLQGEAAESWCPAATAS